MAKTFISQVPELFARWSQTKNKDLDPEKISTGSEKMASRKVRSRSLIANRVTVSVLVLLRGLVSSNARIEHEEA